MSDEQPEDPPRRTSKSPNVTHLVDEVVPRPRIAEPNEGHPFAPKKAPAPPEAPKRED